MAPAASSMPLRKVPSRCLTIIAVLMMPAPGAACLTPAPLFQQTGRTLKEHVGVHVSRSLREAAGARSLQAAAGRLKARLGSGAYLLPFLAGHFDEPEAGLLAVRHAGRLEGVRAPQLATELARLRRTTPAFAREAGTALRALCSADELEAAARRWRAAESPALRAAGFWATPRTAGARKEVVGLLAVGTRAELELAVGWLLAGRGTGLDLLVAALADPKGDPGRRMAALQRVLDADAGLLPWVMPRLVAAPGLLEPARRLEVRQPRRLELVAELLALPPGPGSLAWLSWLTDASSEASRSSLLRRALAHPGIPPLLAETARRPAPPGSKREAMRTLLPSRGLVLPGRRALWKLLPGALPAHTPFLAASLHLASWPSRAWVASRLHQLGHAAGLETLKAGLAHERAGVRREVVRSLVGGGRVVVPLVEQALQDSAAGVRAAAREVLQGDELPLRPAVGFSLLARASFPDSRVLLEALDRHPDRAGLRAAAARALDLAPGRESPEANPDLDGLAQRLFRDWAPHGDLVQRGLEHPRAAVRARAVEAWGRGCRPPGRSLTKAVRDLEELVADPDVVVRAQTARALGRMRHGLARTLLVFLTGDGHALVRAAAVRSLAGQERCRVIPVLRKASRDPHRWVRHAARLALLAHGETDAARGLVNVLDHPVLGAEAAHALEELLGAPWSTQQELIKALDEHVGGWRREE